MPIVGKSEDVALRMIEDGQLRWAFNVAFRNGRGAKALRVLPRCVGDFMAGRQCEMEFADVAAALTCGASETIAATEIAAGLNISSTHVYHLISSGQLKARSGWHSGPRGSARVRLDSFVGFLRERAYPFPAADD